MGRGAGRGKGRRSFALALLCLCWIAASRPAAGDTPTDVVYVVRRGWHVDLGFAATTLVPPLAALAGDFPGARYLLFGFGDRHYLLARRRNAPVLLAALWPGAGLILTTGLATDPDTAFGAAQVIALHVTPSQLRSVQGAVWNSLQKRDDAVAAYAPGPYQGSEYFAAVPRYSATHTCNTWVAENLKAAGLPVRSTGVLFAGQLWQQVRRLR
jgi:hypothetical protein